MSHLVARLAFIAIVLLGAFLAGTVAAEEQRRRIAGTAVFGEIPPGFVEERNYPGPRNRALHASITALEGPIETPLEKLFSSPLTLNIQVLAKGIFIESIETLTTKSGAKIRLARGTQIIGKRRLRKWMGGMRDKTAVIVNFHIDEDQPFSDDSVRAFYRSLAFGEPLTVPEILEQLSFTIDVAEPFRVTASMGGLGVILVSGPDPVGRGGKHPFIMALRDISTNPDDDIEKYAEASLRSTQSFRRAIVKSTRKIVFAGRDGIELEGTSRERGAPIVFKQRFVIIEKGVALRIVAGGSEAEMKRLNDQIERIFMSVGLK